MPSSRHLLLWDCGGLRATPPQVGQSNHCSLHWLPLWCAPCKSARATRPSCSCVRSLRPPPEWSREPHNLGAPLPKQSHDKLRGPSAPYFHTLVARLLNPSLWLDVSRRGWVSLCSERVRLQNSCPLQNVKSCPKKAQDGPRMA